MLNIHVSMKNLKTKPLTNVKAPPVVSYVLYRTSFRSQTHSLTNSNSHWAKKLKTGTAKLNIY